MTTLVFSPIDSGLLKKIEIIFLMVWLWIHKLLFNVTYSFTRISILLTNISRCFLLCHTKVCITVKSMWYPTQWYCLWYYLSSELLFYIILVLRKATPPTKDTCYMPSLLMPGTHEAHSFLSHGVFIRNRCQLIKTFANKVTLLFLPNSMPCIINSVILKLAVR